MRSRTLYHYQLQAFVALDNPFLDEAKFAKLQDKLERQGIVLESPTYWKNPDVSESQPELDGAWTIQKSDQTLSKWKLEYVEMDWTEELEDELGLLSLAGTVQVELVSWHTEEILPESD